MTGEEETVSQVPVTVANGTIAPEKSDGVMVEEKEGVKDEVEEKSHGEKTECEHMENETGEKEGKEKKEESVQEETIIENDKEKDVAAIKVHEEANDPRRDDGVEEKVDSEELVKEKVDFLEEEGKVEEIEEGKEEEGEKEAMEEKADGLEEEGKEEEKEEIRGEEMEGKEEEGEEEAMEEKQEEEVEEEKKQEEDDDDDDEEEKQKAVQKKERGTKKHGRGKVAEERKSGEGKIEKKKKVVETPEPRTPAFERPQRERKSVERLVASMERDVSKEFQIPKGRGTPLKDIPNVAFKLSRRKVDDSFKLLHTILFGRRAKAVQVKSNILRFSGFVWSGSEEKHMSKVKEKFDKCNKEKLLEFCEVFDIPIAKSSTKKEDIIAKLTEFLVAPHATTTVLLAEKEASKSNKRKRVAKSSSRSSSSKRSAKMRKRAENGLNTAKKSRFDSEDESEEENKEAEEEEEEEEEEENEIEKEENAEEDDENGLPEKSDAQTPEPSDSEKDESEEESEEETKKRRNKKPSQKNSANKTKTNKATVSKKTSPVPKRTSKKSSAKRPEVDSGDDDDDDEDATPKPLPKKRRSAVDDDSDSAPKALSKKKKSDTVAKKPSLLKSAPKEKAGEFHSTSSSNTKAVSSDPIPVLPNGRKRAAKGMEKLPQKGKAQPSDDELREAICEILKEVDFNTATFTDILKRLAKQYNMDLTPRKSTIKLMIQEELTKMADDEDEEGDADKEDKQLAGEEVKA